MLMLLLRWMQVLVEFVNAAHADQAFASLSGRKHRDSGGRFQKNLQLPGALKTDKEVAVRRMAAHNGTLLQSKPPKSQVEKRPLA